MMENKVYGVILAGGQGTRMGNTEKPKQFLELGGKPILLHSVDAFRRNPRIDAFLVLTPREWVPYTRDLLQPYLQDSISAETPSDKSLADGNTSEAGGAGGANGKPGFVLAGGATRNETLMEGIRFLEAHFSLDETTCLVTHDAVRPLVTDQIINANIDCVLAGGTCTTAVPATDTLLLAAQTPNTKNACPGEDTSSGASALRSSNKLFISDIPDRSRYFMAQTPQSFRALRFRDHYLSLSPVEREILTDASKVFVLKGDPVTIVPGHPSNMKITYAEDLAVAEALLSY